MIASLIVRNMFEKKKGLLVFLQVVYNPLYVASEKGCKEMVELLMSEGRSFDSDVVSRGY